MQDIDLARFFSKGLFELSVGQRSCGWHSGVTYAV
jgi:hypothetical protein